MRSAASSLISDSRAALIAAFNDLLLKSPSATSVLENWYNPANESVRAVKASITRRDATPEQRLRLQVAASQPIAYRHVRLIRGRRILSEAEIWYIPERLTGDMNDLLARTDRPFGDIIRSLEPARQAISVHHLWEGGRDLPAYVLQHRALILDQAKRPIAEVSERYTRRILALD